MNGPKILTYIHHSHFLIIVRHLGHSFTSQLSPPSDHAPHSGLGHVGRVSSDYGIPGG